MSRFQANWQTCSVKFSSSVVSNSLWPHGLQHTSLPCPLLSPEVCSNAYPLMTMTSNHLILCHLLLLLPSIFPSLSIFSNELALHIRCSKYWSFSFTISPSSEYSRLISFRIDWISLLSKGLSKVFSNTTVQKHQFFSTQLSSQSNSHIHKWLLEKP